MCGIAGIFKKEAHAIIDQGQLWKMINVILHRGPDAQNIWHEPGVGLTHARLSIIDLDERSNQPMVDPNSGRVIIFNGEIYNYIEIRAELINLGYSFTTKSDTEVILKAYDCFGPDCLNRFNGMWAFVIYDPKKKEIFAARDRFGIKPFSYGILPNGDLIFASEAKALTETFPYFNKPNLPFVYGYLERDISACYQDTFYDKIFNLMPGHYFTIKHGETPQQKRYWNWTPKLMDQVPSDNEIIDHFQFLLTDAIKLRLRTDVTFGSCLSGGMDSPTLVALASKIANKPISTFSCVYPDMPHFDESFYIDSIVKQYNTHAHFTTPKHDDFLQTMMDCTVEQDGPTGGPSILSQRAVMKLAKNNVIVLLDGQGADEVLGGYHGYFYYSLLSAIREKRLISKNASWLKYLIRSWHIKRRTGNPRWNFGPLWLQTNQSPNFNVPKIENSQLHALLPFEKDDLNTILLEHTFTNLPNLLHYEDRNSMKYSLEARLPYLDYRLVEFAFSLPHHYKIRGKTTKWLLYQVAQKVLPKTVLNRKDKMGFTTPGHAWFRNIKNNQYFKKYFTNDNMIFSQISESQKQYLHNAWKKIYSDEKLLPEDAGYVNALWRFCTTHLWLEKMGYI